MIRLQVLGTLDLRDANGDECRTLLRRPKLTALLVYLDAARPTGFHRRDHLATLFWPDLDQGHARNALRQALHHLRESLGHDAVISRGDEEIGLVRTHVWSDTTTFTNALANNQGAEALALYRGDLLPGFHLPDAPEFERWLDQEREDLRRRAANTARDLALAAAAAGHTTTAVDWERRALDFDPYNEQTLQRLLRLLGRSGDRARVAREFDRFERRLKEDLDLTPSAETNAALDAALAPALIPAITPGITAVTTIVAMVAAPPPSPPAAGRRAQRRWWLLAAAPIALWIVFRLIAGVVAPEPAVPPAPGWPDAGPSLAVLPLANLSGDPAKEYYADGLTDALITELASVGGMRVISRTSVMRYKGPNHSVPEIGRELGVELVLEGGVLVVGDRVRITAQLIQAATDFHLWAQSYERDARGVLTLQRDIARDVAQALQRQLTLRDRARLRQVVQVQPEVSEAYLRGLHAIGRLAFDEAISQFQTAIRLDSGFAPAYAGLARAYNGQVFFGARTASGVSGLATTAARRAIALDPSLAEALVALGDALAMNWAWSGAEAAYRRAIALNPGQATTNASLASFLAIMGRNDEAIEYARRALSLDPMSGMRSQELGELYLVAGRRAEAVAQLQLSLELHPELEQTRATLAVALMQAGRHEEGVALMRAYAKGGDTNRSAELAWALGVAGQAGEARRLIAGIPTDPEHAIGLAAALTALSARDAAFGHLEEAVGTHMSQVPFLRADPRFVPLHGDPRWERLLMRIFGSP